LTTQKKKVWSSLDISALFFYSRFAENRQGQVRDFALIEFEAVIEIAKCKKDPLPYTLDEAS